MLLPCVDCESVPTLETREGPTFHHITSKPSYFEAVVTCCTPKHTTRARDRRNSQAAVASVRKSWNKKMLSLQTQRVVEELERYLNMASERRDIWRVEEAVNELRSMRAYCEKNRSTPWRVEEAVRSRRAYCEKNRLTPRKEEKR